MKCPTCNVDLQMSERSGIEIDYCPQCRGVWLDRGELDKIIERSFATSAEKPREEYRETPHYDKDKYHHDKHYKYGKRKSFISEIFDF